MLYDCPGNNRVYLILFAAACICSWAGCTQHNYKKEADEQVYRIIDQKWQKDFGSKVNYKISDTEPSPNDIQIEKAVPPSGVLTLPQAVAMATAHNRDYQIQKELLYSMALDLRLTRHQFETQYFGGLSGGYGADWNDSAVGLETNLGFNWLLAAGTMISAKVSGAYVDVLTGNMQSGLASVLTTTLTQPLLRGSDPAVVLENLTQAERNALYQIRSFSRFRKTFVVLVITQYYEVLKLYDLVKNAETNYNILARLSERVEKLAHVGRLPTFELDRIHQEMLQARDTYIQARKEYELWLDQFKIVLGLPTKAELRLDEDVLDTLKATEMTYPDFKADEAIQTALARRLDLANSADSIADAKRQVFVASDALRAELNLTGTADIVSGQRGNRRTTRAVTEDYLLDLDLNLPLDRVFEQNVYRKALITLNQRQREYELATDTITMEVRQAFRDLQEATERYKLQSEGFRLAQERFRKTHLLMKYARASSRRVLDAQRDMFDAQNELTEASVNYAIAMLNFYRDTGVLQVRPDGMWEKGLTDSRAATSRTAPGITSP